MQLQTAKGLPFTCINPRMVVRIEGVGEGTKIFLADGKDTFDMRPPEKVYEVWKTNMGSGPWHA